MNNNVWMYEIYRLKTVIESILRYQIIMTAPHIFNATIINSQLLTGTMFILLSRGAECTCLMKNCQFHPNTLFQHDDNSPQITYLHIFIKYFNLSQSKLTVLVKLPKLEDNIISNCYFFSK